MEENIKIEDIQNEELLNKITGGTGRIEDCPTCSQKIVGYNNAKALHEHFEAQVDNFVLINDTHNANIYKNFADQFYAVTKDYYHLIQAHGHENFPPPQNPPAG